MSSATSEAGAKARAGYIVALGFSAVARDEFDDWLDLEHNPERLALPGFVSATRWLATDDSTTSLTHYEIESLAVLESDAYRGITGPNLSPWSRRVIGRCKRARWDVELTMHLAKPGAERAEGLLVVAMNVQREAEEEFDRWYTQEHAPSLFELPGVLDARRYRAVAGDQKHIAMYHLADPDVQASAAWKKAIDTPWGSRVRPHTRDRVRYVCRRYRRTT